MKRFFTLTLVVGAAVGVFYLIGLITPRLQSANARAPFAAVQHHVYPVIADVGDWESWFPDIMSTTERAEKNGHPAWSITDVKGRTYELEVTVDSPSSAWSGMFDLEGTRWTMRFDVKHYADGSLVLYSEQRDSRSPWLRARRAWNSRDAAAEQILIALGGKFGETVVPMKNRKR